MHHDPETRRVWYVVLGVSLIIAAIILGAVLLPGCSSQKPAQSNAMEEKIDTIHEVAVRTSDVVEGDHNTLEQINDNSQTTLSNTTKIIEQLQQTVGDGLGVMSREIGSLNASVKNVHNSSLLMGYIIGVMAVVILVMIGILGGVIYKLITMKIQIQRVFASDDTDLTEEKWRAILAARPGSTTST